MTNFERIFVTITAIAAIGFMGFRVGVIKTEKKYMSPQEPQGEK